MLCWEKSSTFCVQSIDIDPIPCYGTTHADYFYGEIPCVRCLTKEEINSAYEENTGHLIVSEFKRMKKDVMAVPAVLYKRGPKWNGADQGYDRYPPLRKVGHAGADSSAGITG